MAIDTIGLITITSTAPSGATVRLDTDPTVYKTSWPRRQSIHEGIGGSVTKQDGGRVAKDMTLRLESGGKGQWLNKATVIALEAFANDKGQTYTFKDGEGNEYTVTFEGFEPDQADGLVDLYVYVLDLHVFGITKRLGATYSGS